MHIYMKYMLYCYSVGSQILNRGGPPAVGPAGGVRPVRASTAALGPGVVRGAGAVARTLRATAAAAVGPGAVRRRARGGREGGRKEKNTKPQHTEQSPE